MRFFCSKPFWTVVIVAVLIGFGHAAAAVEVQRDDHQVTLKVGDKLIVLLIGDAKRVNFPDGDVGLLVPVANNIYSIGIYKSDCDRGHGTVTLIANGQVAAQGQFGPDSSPLDLAIVAEICRAMDRVKGDRRS